MLFRPPQGVPISAMSPSVFMAGGITGAPDWQTPLAAALQDTGLTLFNPRREEYDDLTPVTQREQIRWEHDHLRAASAISFWFPASAVCLITMYELGSWAHWRDPVTGAPKPIFVAAHPNYARREDVVIQMELERPDVTVGTSLHDLELQIRAWHGAR